MKKRSPQLLLNKVLPVFIAAGIIVAFILGVRGYYTIQESAEKNGLNQLIHTTEFFSQTLILGIDNRKQILQDLAMQLQIGSSKKGDTIIDLSGSTIRQAFSHFQHECNYIFFINKFGEVEEAKNWLNGKVTTEDVDKVRPYLEKDTSFPKILEQKPYSQSGKEYFWQKSSFINLYQTVTDEQGNFQGFLVAPLNLEQFYQHELKVKSNSYKGYPMIKNRDMIVVMHPVRDQIGLNIVDDRKKKFPGLDFTDLEKLEEQQLSQKQGVAKYYSYWWDEKSLPRALKLQAFQWIDVGEAQWVVAYNSDFYELNKTPLINAQILMVLLVIVLMAIIFFIVQYYRREKFYLLEANKQQATLFELEKKLYQENKLETIGLLTTTIVHDMNNFLTPIIGNAELLIEENQDNKQLQEDLKEILLAAQKGKELSSNVLRFSRNQPNKKVKEQDLSKNIFYAIDTIKGMIPKNIHLYTHVTDNIGTSKFQSQDLQILIFNLITNAYQAISQTSKEGEITIILKEATSKIGKNSWFDSYLKRKEKYALLIIEDTGPGMSQELLDTVFNPFVTIKKTNGTGLGLFVVSSIAKKYGWGLHVDSTPGIGTRFTIVIPIHIHLKHE